MAYMLYFFSLLFILAATSLVLTRNRWLHLVPAVNLPSVRLPGAGYLYSRLPTSFAGDMDAGLSSAAFDLSGNIEDGDSRAGLDEAGKREVLKIMKKRRLNFDQARKVFIEKRFKQNGIGADGRPRDPKFVSFS